MVIESPQSSTALARREERKAFLARVVPGETMAKLEEAHDQFFGALSVTDLTVPERTLLASVAINQLKAALRGPILDNVIMPLMNSSIGFDTDRNPAKHQPWMRSDPPTPYEKEVVLACASEAWLHGLPMIGNCWNIIAGGMYPRKEGFERLLSEVCRFSAAVDVPPITQELFENGGYLKIPVRIKYQFKGEPDDASPLTFGGVYSVRLNKKNAVAVEACEGKAKRKAYRDLWLAISGVLLPDADDLDQRGSVHQVGAHFDSGESNGATIAEILGKDAAPAKEAAAVEAEPAEAPKLAAGVVKRLRTLAQKLEVSVEAIEEELGAPIGELPATMETELESLIRTKAKAGR